VHIIHTTVLLTTNFTVNFLPRFGIVLLGEAPTVLSVRKEFELSTRYPSRDDLSVFVATVALLETVRIISLRPLLPAEVRTSFWFYLPSTRSIDRYPYKFLSHVITALLNHETPTIPADSLVAFKTPFSFSDFVYTASRILVPSTSSFESRRPGVAGVRFPCHHGDSCLT
jgi:hypothetical protein